MSTKKTYKISKTKRLIDLNGSTVNFELEFSVRSVNNVPFQATVVDQSILDSGKQLDYQVVKNGTLTGTLTHDDNKYQNFFLVLKADNECNCEVELTKREIAPKQEQPVLNTDVVHETKAVPVDMIKNPSEYDWSKVLLTVVVIAGLCLAGYWLWTKYTEEQVHVLSSMEEVPRIEVETPRIEVPIVEEVPMIEMPVVEVPEIELPEVELPKMEMSELPKVEIVNPLIDKLKRLKLTS